MENILFENTYEVTPALTRKWNSLSFKRSARHNKYFTLAGKLVFAITAILCFVIGVMRRNGATLTLSCLLFLGCLIFFLVPRSANKKRYKNFLKFHGLPNWIQTLRFGEHIEVQSGNSCTTYRYDQITFIDENDACFCLWVNNALLVMVYKNAFVTGDADAFRDFIHARTQETGALLTKKQLNKTAVKRLLPRIAFLLVFTIAVPLNIVLDPTGIYGSNYHINKDGTREANYQKDMDTIYFAQWAVFRTQEDTAAYKIDLKNNEFLYIGSNAALSKERWGTEQGDADFRFISTLENSKIDSFFRETARHGFTNWDEYYEDKSIMDGSEWYIKIVFAGGTVKEMSGVNKYPETWKYVIADFEHVTGYQFK